MSDNKAINPPTSPPWIVDETAPSNLIVTSDTVMVEREVDADISIDQPPPPAERDKPDAKSTCRERKRGKIHDMESVKNLGTYIKYMLLKEGEVLELDGRVFKKDLEADEVRLRKYLVRKNNNAANAAMNKKIKLDKDQLNKDGMTKDLSEQLKEKEAIIENLREKLNEKIADYNQLTKSLREKEATITIMDDLRKSSEDELKAKEDKLDRLQLSCNGGYAFGSTGNVIDRERQVSVVLCLLLHFDKSRGLIIMCHILQYPSSMIRCSESRFCRRPATTRMRKSRDSSNRLRR